MTYFFLGVFVGLVIGGTALCIGGDKDESTRY